MKTEIVTSSQVFGSSVTSQMQVRKAMLACGALSSLVYIAATIIGGLVWKGYNPLDQAVSELSAYGAPSRPVVVAMFLIFDVLLIMFGIGVWREAGQKRSLRIVAFLIAGYGVICLTAPFTSMNIPGSERTLSDTLHLIGTAAGVLIIFLIIGFGINAFGRRFRLYSIGTLLVLLVFGGWSASLGPRVAANVVANLPTPWFGVIERILIFSFLQWIAVLAIALLRKK